MNYTQLQATVADWLHRTDLDDVIPAFIKLAESRINRDLRVAEMEAVATGSHLSGDIALPDDYRQVKSLLVDGRPMAYMSQLQGEVYAGQQPYGYTQIGNVFKLYPSGGERYTLHYYASIPSLSDIDQSNWLLTKYPDVYLYATLLESAPYIKDDARVQTWAAAYQNAIGTVMAQDTVQKYGDAGLVIRGA